MGGVLFLPSPSLCTQKLQGTEEMDRFLGKEAMACRLRKVRQEQVAEGSQELGEDKECSGGKRPRRTAPGTADYLADPSWRRIRAEGLDCDYTLLFRKAEADEIFRELEKEVEYFTGKQQAGPDEEMLLGSCVWPWGWSRALPVMLRGPHRSNTQYMLLNPCPVPGAHTDRNEESELGPISLRERQEPLLGPCLSLSRSPKIGPWCEREGITVLS